MRESPVQTCIQAIFLFFVKLQQTFVKLQHQKFPGVLPSTYLRKKVFIKKHLWKRKEKIM